MYGWVLEGFCYNKEQIELLKTIRVKPNLVIVLDLGEEEAVRRLSNKRIDPENGTEYNLEVNPPADEATNNRLVELVECSDEVVRKVYRNWKKSQTTIEEHFRSQIMNTPAERTIDELQDVLLDEIDQMMKK